MHKMSRGADSRGYEMCAAKLASEPCPSDSCACNFVFHFEGMCNVYRHTCRDTHRFVCLHIHTERRRETYKLLTAAYSRNSFCLMALLGFLIVMTNWLPSNAEMGKASWSYRRNMRTYLTMCKGTQGLFYFFFFFDFFFFLREENRKGGLKWNNVNHLAVFLSRSHPLWMLCQASSWVDCCQFRRISEEYYHALSVKNGNLHSSSQNPSSPQHAHSNIWHKWMPRRMLTDGGLNPSRQHSSSAVLWEHPPHPALPVLALQPPALQRPSQPHLRPFKITQSHTLANNWDFTLILVLFYILQSSWDTVAGIWGGKPH